MENALRLCRRPSFIHLCTKMASNMFLYWGSGSPPCWRVMIALEEKGLQGYQQKLISFEKKEHKSEEVLKLNPRGQAPTFRDGDIVVNDSLAIIQYLESAYSGQGTKLYPEDKAKLALVLQKQYETLNLALKATEVMYYTFRTKKEDQDPAELAKRKATLAEEVQMWENNMSSDGGYIAGPDFTMADVLFYPAVAFMVRLGAPRKALGMSFSKTCEQCYLIWSIMVLFDKHAVIFDTSSARHAKKMNIVS